MTGYPWVDGDVLYAADLNAAIASSAASVLVYGAKGDGLTDDTAAIQAALNANAGKAVVLVPDTGNPYMVNPLVVPTGTDLLIHGTLMLRPNNTNLVLRVQNVSNVTIRGHGTIDGNAAGQTTNASGAINVGTCTNLLISGVTLQNSRNWNLNITNSTHVIVDGIRSLNGGNANEFAAGSTDCWIRNSHIDGTHADFGFAFYGGCTNCGAIGNTITNTAVGIFVFADSGQPAACQEIVITDNILYNNWTGAIQIGSLTVNIHGNILIANNRCYGNNQSGNAGNSEIWVDNCRGIILANNHISIGEGSINPCGKGIGLGTNGWRAAIIGNNIQNMGSSTEQGIGLYINSSINVLATGNTFHESRAPAYMAYSMSGTAGANNVYLNNNCDVLPQSVTLAADTVSANAAYGQWQANTPISIHGSISSQNWQAQGGIIGWNYAGNGMTNFINSRGGGTGGFTFYNVASSSGATPALLATIDSNGMLTVGGQVFSTLPTNAANDAAAASMGVPVGGEYRNGSVMMVRTV